MLWLSLLFGGLSLAVMLVHTFPVTRALIRVIKYRTQMLTLKSLTSCNGIWVVSSSIFFYFYKLGGLFAPLTTWFELNQSTLTLFYRFF